MSKEFTITKMRNLLETDEKFKEQLRRAIASNNPKEIQRVLARMRRGASSSSLVDNWDELVKTNEELRNVRMSGSFLKAAITKALRKGFAVLLWADILDSPAHYGEENPEGDPVRSRLQRQQTQAVVRHVADVGLGTGAPRRTPRQQRADRRLHIITSGDDITNLDVWYRSGVFPDTNPVVVAVPRSVIPRNWIKGRLSGGMWGNA